MCDAGDGAVLRPGSLTWKGERRGVEPGSTPQKGFHRRCTYGVNDRGLNNGQHPFEVWLGYMIIYGRSQKVGTWSSSNPKPTKEGKPA